MPEFTLVTLTLKVKVNTKLSDTVGENLSREVRDDIDDTMEDLAKELQFDYPEVQKVVWNF